MNTEYTQGLGKGWFGNFLKSVTKVVATVVATAIGGPVGGLIGAYASTYIDDIWPEEWGQRGIDAGRGSVAGRGTQEEVMENFIKNLFQPWFIEYTKIIRGSENINTLKSLAYRSAVNNVLRALEKLRVYYQFKGETVNYQGRGSVVGGLDVDTSDVKTKEELFALMQQAVKNAYIKAMSDIGEKTYLGSSVFKPIDFKLTVPFNASFDWEGVDQQSNLEIFVGKPTTGSNDNGSVLANNTTKQDFTTPPINPSTPTTTTTETNQNQNSDEEVPVNQTINNTPTTTTSNTESKKNNYLIPTLGLGTIIALLAFGNKKKK